MVSFKRMAVSIPNLQERYAVSKWIASSILPVSSVLHEKKIPSEIKLKNRNVIFFMASSF